MTKTKLLFILLGITAAIFQPSLLRSAEPTPIKIAANNIAVEAATNQIPVTAYLHPVDRIFHRILDRIVSKEAQVEINKVYYAKTNEHVESLASKKVSPADYPKVAKELKFVTAKLGYKSEITLIAQKHYDGKRRRRDCSIKKSRF